jgi:hypothetical protein
MDKLISILLFLSCFAQNKSLEFSFQIPKDKIFIHRFEFNKEIKGVITLCECVKAKVFPDKDKYILEVKLDPKEIEKEKFSQEIILKDKDNHLIKLKLNFEILSPS